MSDYAMQDSLGAYLMTRASVPVIVAGENNLICSANPFALRQFGRFIVGKPLESLFLNLDGSLDIPSLIANAESPVLLSVAAESGMPQSWMFSFVRSEGKIAIIGEHDYNEIDSTRRGLIEVSNQLSNTMRDLYKANAELARLNEMKNEFLGIAAHDLRTPIGNISSLSGMLLDDVGNLLPEEHVELLLTIRSLSEFMLTMLENLLDITAIESGKVTLSRDRLDLATIVKRAIKLNKILADRKGIGVEILAEASIAVVGDAHKLQQVLDNLISNAIKYSERDTLIQVTVRTAKNEAIVSVIDHGPGLGEDDIAKLFRPFFRARSKATGGEKSTGLGLAIVQRIIQAHNGRVWVESRVGYGSIFSFALPTDNDYLNIPTGDR